MASSLPDSPSLDRLRVEARRLQRGVRAGDPAALRLVAERHPRPPADLAGLPLHDAQLVVARIAGFSGWPALVAFLGSVAELGADPSAVDEAALDPADRFATLAALRYDDRDAPPRREAAAALLAAAPELVAHRMSAAATAADPRAVGRLLDADPASASRRDGPHGWPPLLHLCFARLDPTERDTLAVVDLLLDAGADPDAGYLWRGMSTPFTALTGAFGEGEQGPRRQPRHPHATALATRLLERGAHPFDQQALYNRMFRPDDSHLELLFAFGLSAAAPSPWERRLGEAMETRAEAWERQVAWAAEHGFTARLALLERHGIDVGAAAAVEPPRPDDPTARDESGATALHRAAWDGDADRVRALLAAGADPAAIEPVHGGTPLDWAEHAYQEETAEVLRALRPRS